MGVKRWVGSKRSGSSPVGGVVAKPEHRTRAGDPGADPRYCRNKAIPPMRRPSPHTPSTPSEEMRKRELLVLECTGFSCGPPTFFAPGVAVLGIRQESVDEKVDRLQFRR